jgi:hypothetical protein
MELWDMYLLFLKEQIEVKPIFTVIQLLPEEHQQETPMLRLAL